MCEPDSRSLLARVSLKEIYFNRFIDSAERINQGYFTSAKGFRLGDSKEKALGIYGKPHQYSATKDLETCEWTYKGDYGEAATQQAKKSDYPLAQDSAHHLASPPA